jgi:hypothetical protein
MAGRRRKSHDAADSINLKKGKGRSELGYKFDPMPKCTIELVRRNALKPPAVLVLQVLLNYSPNGMDSCWTTTDRIVAETGFSRASVNRHLKELKCAGLIERRRLRGPDTIDSKNETGHRFYLLFAHTTHCARCGTSSGNAPQHHSSNESQNQSQTRLKSETQTRRNKLDGTVTPIHYDDSDEDLVQQQTVYECLSRLDSERSRDAVNDAAAVLSESLDDKHSLDNYRAKCWQVANGEVPCGELILSWDLTMAKLRNGVVVNPGAYFFGVLDRCPVSERVFCDEVRASLAEND